MDQSDDLPPNRRTLFVPVIVATVFLSIIGMSAGLVLGSRQKADDRAGRQVQQQPALETATPGPRRSGPPCRSETRSAARSAGAAGQLVQVLRLRTRTSEVYVCADQAGSLFYHANNGGRRWIEGETALFLPDVAEGPDGYRVTAGDGTVFTVSPQRLFIEHRDGRTEEQPAA